MFPIFCYNSDTNYLYIFNLFPCILFLLWGQTTNLTRSEHNPTEIVMYFRKWVYTVMAPIVDHVCYSVRRRKVEWTLRLGLRATWATAMQRGVQGHLRLQGSGAPAAAPDQSISLRFKDRVVIPCFFFLFSDRMSSRCLVVTLWLSLTRVRTDGGWCKETAWADWFLDLILLKCDPDGRLLLF